MPDSEIPSWLQQRVKFGDNSVSQDLSSGFNMGMQLRQQARMEKAQALQEEIRRLALDEKERVAQGSVEVTRVLSEMGSTGGYTDPKLQAKFWDAVSRNPKFATSSAFKEILDTFQYAEQAKYRSDYLKSSFGFKMDQDYGKHLDRLDEMASKLDAQLEVEGTKQEGREVLTALRGQINMLRDREKGGIAQDLEVLRQKGRMEVQTLKGDISSFLEEQRQGGRLEVEETRQLGRTEVQAQKDLASMDRMRQSLENSLTLQDARSEDAKELRELQHQLDVVRDAKKPATRRPEQLDLNESDRMTMKRELDDLGLWRKANRGKKYDVDYDKRLKAIEDKYEGKRKKPGAGLAPAPSDKRVRVKSPNGKIGLIPESQLEDALKQGYTPAP